MRQHDDQGSIYFLGIIHNFDRQITNHDFTVNPFIAQFVELTLDIYSAVLNVLAQRYTFVTSKI